MKKDRKNIMFLATTDVGGAGIAARKLNEMLLLAGHNSFLVVKESVENNENVIVLKKTSKKYNLFTKVVNYVKVHLNPILFRKKYCFYSNNEKKKYGSVHEIISAVPQKPDVIILLWVANFLNAKMIAELSKIVNGAIFWYFLDNAPLTGGCHYPWDCKGYLTDCSNCPAIRFSLFKGLAKRNLQLKRKYIPDSMQFIAPSSNAFSNAQRSSLYENCTLHKVHLSVDQNLYTNMGMSLAKKSFNIDERKKVVFCGALSLGNIRKGMSYFIEALQLLQLDFLKEGKRLDDYCILIAGNGDRSCFDEIDIPIIFTGFLSQEKLAKAYQASDVFVSTSLADYGPLMIYQAVSCGTPVVSFDIGIALDLVVHKKNGYLVPVKNVSELSNGIRYILEQSDEAFACMSENCIRLATKKCNPEVHLNNLVDVLLTTS